MTVVFNGTHEADTITFVPLKVPVQMISCLRSGAGAAAVITGSGSLRVASVDDSSASLICKVNLQLSPSSSEALLLDSVEVVTGQMNSGKASSSPSPVSNKVTVALYVPLTIVDTVSTW